ncbi:hypothetical protein D3C80_1392500 [compost metagenome]
MVCHFVAPNAKLASLNSRGIVFNASSTETIITGSVNNAIVKLAHRILGCPQCNSPLLKAESIPVPTNWIKNPSPKRPKIIEGTTANVLIENRTAAANFEFSFAYSVKYIAVTVPKGTAAIDITITNIKVPIKAGKIPPLVIPSVGKELINSQENFSRPW